MKLFRTVVFATCLAIGSFVVTAQAPKVEAPKEYVLGVCGGDGVTVIHATIAQGKLVFDYYLADDKGTIVKEEEPLIFSYVPGEVDKQGNIEFSGEATIDVYKLELKGLIRGNRIVGMIFANNQLAEVIYGHVGKVDDVVKDADSDLKFCVVLHEGGVSQIPKALANFLKQVDSGPANQILTVN